MNTESTVMPPAATLGEDAHETGTSVDAENPWLGLASFTEESQAYFFGREGEVAELTRRVQRKLLTVLFGKSGLGKTSILRAGLVPRLRAQGYFPVYLRIDYGRDSPEPAEQIKLAIGKAAASGEWTQIGVAAPGESIWEFLHHRDDVLKDKSGQTLIPLLIFDQFEELFTLAQSDEFGRARASRFIEELADLVENRPPHALEAKLDGDDSIAERFDFSRSDYRVVIALREDYLAPLESLKKTMPSLSQNRLRLAPMTGTQALEAVLQPGNRLRPTKPLVSEEVAEAIVRFVAGGSELSNAEVEPSLLSLICRELNEQRIAQGRSEISQDLLAGSHDTILSNFYERSLADQPESVRRIIEDDLLTESGYRENLAEESLLRRFQAAGAAPDALSKLVNRRLLRIEERLDVRRVELTHDVLTGVVKASRDLRHEREAREASDRALFEQRAREQAAHRALRRARAVAAGCTLLAAVALAAAIVALVSFRRARHAELIASETRAISEQARQEAEGLLGFLTDDLVQELSTFGRYQTIAELSQREIDYFQHLPPQLKDPESVRSDGLALINHTFALINLGDLAAARKNVTEAVTLLEQLRRTDRSDSTVVMLGRAHSERGLVLADQNDPQAYTEYEQAIDLLRPIATQPHSAAEARRAYLEALLGAALQDWISQRLEQAVKAAHESVSLSVELGARRGVDAALVNDYLSGSADLVAALASLGRNDEVIRAGEAALPVADRTLARYPQFGWVLLNKANILSSLGTAAANELQQNEASRLVTQAMQTDLALVRLEPKDTSYLNQLGDAYWDVGAQMWSVGRLRAATAFERKAIETLAKATAGGVIQIANLTETATYAASLQAQLGDLAGASTTLATAAAVTSRLHLHGGATGLFIATEKAAGAAMLAYERGDLTTARRVAGDALRRLHTHPLGAFQIALMNSSLCDLVPTEGQAEYLSHRFAQAEQSERTAFMACKAITGFGLSGELAGRRTVAKTTIWLSMALAREGKRAEASKAIDPVVTMYRGLMKKNHGDQWLPLEFAEALYAESLAEPQHRAALLHEAGGLVDHLIPPIARLHDTRQWRARIEAAQ
jgi:tetratricopeptide (TPR) repeat protein